MSVALGSAYYRGKHLLLTGTTGFVGKVLLEAILRTLPEVGRVYVLIRPRVDKRGVPRSAGEVLAEEVLASSAFDRWRSERREEFDTFVSERIRPIAGDLGRERLGMSSADYEEVRREVDVIINSAALAVFDAPLDQALEINTLGPQRVLALAKDSVRRPFLAHISTCYVNNVVGPVFETPLEPDWTPSGESFAVEHEVEELQQRIAEIRADHHGGRSRRLVEEGLRQAQRRGWRDTYTYTKAMGEQLLGRHRGDQPMLILRPSIIESALQNPAPGWIDGFRMMDPLIVGFGRGQLREFPGHPEAVMDVVPVDVVVHALLAAIPWTHLGSGGIVYQVASGMERPLTLNTMYQYLVEYYSRNPLRRTAGSADGGAARLPQLTFPPVPAFLRQLDRRYLRPVRLLATLQRPLRFAPGGRARQASLNARCTRLEWLRATAAIYGPYAENQARFLTFNLRTLWEALPEEDRRKWPFLLRDFDWKRYFHEVHLPGIERYLLRMRREPRGWDIDSADHHSSLEPTIELEPTRRSMEDPAGGWQRAAKLVSLTRQAGPRDLDPWATPLYKKAIKRASTAAVRTICYRRLMLDTVSREWVPDRGPFILVANHTSHVDTGVLLTALGPLAATAHPTAAADYWYRSRSVAWLLSAMLGAIPFDRFARNIPRAIGLPVAILRHGHSVIFYPEGSRSRDGQVHRFKSTLGLLALASGAPILPAYISGAAEALPKGQSRIKPHPVRVRFGPMIDIAPFLRRLDTEKLSELAHEVAADAQVAVCALREETVVPVPHPDLSLRRRAVGDALAP
jgi:1-acyl-sn-glycerol-3-phosphate acyltransferase